MKSQLLFFACAAVIAFTACSSEPKEASMPAPIATPEPPAAPPEMKPEPLPPTPPHERLGHRGPPKEALQACEGKAAKDSCSFETPHGDTLQGTCMKKPLECRPSKASKRK